jgi:hypothetical protein
MAITEPIIRRMCRSVRATRATNRPDIILLVTVLRIVAPLHAVTHADAAVADAAVADAAVADVAVADVDLAAATRDPAWALRLRLRPAA